MLPLGLLSAGERAQVTEIVFGKGRGPQQGAAAELVRLEEMGLRPGKVVEVLNNAGQGPILLKVDETRIALGRGVAMKVLVQAPGKGSEGSAAAAGGRNG